ARRHSVMPIGYRTRTRSADRRGAAGSPARPGSSHHDRDSELVSERRTPVRSYGDQGGEIATPNGLQVACVLSCPDHRVGGRPSGGWMTLNGSSRSDGEGGDVFT